MKTSKGILLLFFLSFIICCGKPGEEKKEKPTIKPKNVKIMKIKPSSIRSKITLPGNVEAFRDLNLSAEQPGKVNKVRVKEGSVLSGNKCILEVNTDILRLAYDKAKVDLDTAEKSYNRRVELIKKNVISQEEFDKIEQAYKLAKIGLDNARLQYHKGFIKTPNEKLEWVVDEISIEENEFTGAGVPIVHILSTNKLRIIVKVPERVINHIKKNDKVNVFFDTIFPDKPIGGTVIRVGYDADRKTKTFPVEIIVDNKDGKLRPGILSKVEFMLDNIENAVVIPLDAIVTQKQLNFVYVEKDGIAEQRIIMKGVYDIDKTQVLDSNGIFSNGRVEVKKGIELGENLIVDGQSFLKDKDKVKVTEVIDK